jgi:hypothetical protein
LRGKHTARGSAPDHADVRLHCLHDGLERERFTLFSWKIGSFSVG